MKDSQDLLANYGLLTECNEIERFQGWSTLNLGCFSREEHPEIFRSIESVFDLKPKVKKVYLSIHNAEYFDFFDNEDKVNLLNEDAPRLCYSMKGFIDSGFVSLSKQDAVMLARFIIKEKQEIIEETKGIIEELERVENEL